jgi:glutamyl-tRNA synthetase
MSEVRVRIAPSPTGDWHLGNARTALFSYLFARRHGGKFYLRIEDTDQARLVEGAVDRLLSILDWLDLKPDALPDGRPYFVQSENLARYKQVATQLVEEGKAYYCFATAEELEVMRAEQQAKKQAPRYDNRWGYRDLSLDVATKRVEAGEAHVIRFKMPQEGDIIVTDLIRGEVKTQAALLDDFVILKADGFPTYHLAHVIDDHDMLITHVIRGDEWLPSAPRHVEIHKALGWSVPEYAHVPVILGPDKGKLSKRHGAKPVFEYRDDGYLPEALSNFLALLGWSSGTEQEFFTRDELIQKFDFARVQASPAVFDAERLNWFNASYIRKLSVDELLQKIIAFSPEWAERAQSQPEKVKAVVAELQDRMITLKEFDELAAFFFADTLEYDAALLPVKKQTSEDAKKALTIATMALSNVKAWTHDALEAILRKAADQNGLKAGDILWPVRVALTGLPASPGAFEVLVILGQDESLKRIDAAIHKL